MYNGKPVNIISVVCRTANDVLFRAVKCTMHNCAGKSINLVKILNAFQCLAHTHHGAAKQLAQIAYVEIKVAVTLCMRSVSVNKYSVQKEGA